jgi:hypothetical protein
VKTKSREFSMWSSTTSEGDGMSSEHFELFVTFANERYPGCTLEEKLSMYLNHHPVRAVPLLLELLRALVIAKNPHLETLLKNYDRPENTD